MKTPPVIYPILFALFPVLFLYSHNAAELSLSQLILPVMLTCIAVDILWTTLKLIFKDEHKTGVIVSLFALLFFSYGHIARSTESLSVNPVYPFLIEGVLFLAVSLIIILARKDLRSFSSALNITSSFLVIFSLANITSHEIKEKWFLNPPGMVSRNFPPVPKTTGPRETNPDIYYIIFDRYPSADTLKEFFKFDNSELINFLKRRGFYVADKSRQNYPCTFLSLASSLNMTYLTPLLDHVKNSTDRSYAYNLLQNFEAELFLKSHGYKLIHLGSHYNPTKMDKAADLNLYFHYYVLDDFSSMLIENSLFFPLMKLILKIDLEKQRATSPRQQHIAHSNYQFHEFVTLPQIKGPKFVFAHILLPHFPYVFGPNGELLTEEETNKTNHDDSYIKQLSYTNKKLKWVVNQILTQSEHPPIIIIQGDEGPLDLMTEIVKGGDKFDWRPLSGTRLKKYMRILNAYYLPDVEKRSQLYPSITPVNSFRLIFNLYFNTNYQLLKDETYIFESLKYIYRFYNVTDKLIGQ